MASLDDVNIFYPKFEIEIPSLSKKLEFRRYLAKEDKILLIAKQGTNNDIFMAIKQVVENCCLNKKIDISKFTWFDLEYVFVKLYEQSVNSIIKLTIKDQDDKKLYFLDINVKEIFIKRFKEHSKKIKIENNDLTLMLKYPTITDTEKLTDDSLTSLQDKVIPMCLDKLIKGDDVIEFSTSTPEQIAAFVETLDLFIIAEIKNFYDTCPHLYYEIKYTNSLEMEKVLKMDSLFDFFTFR